MELPDRLRGIWDAAAIAERAIALGTPSIIFAETVGGNFPPDVLLRCFGAVSLQLYTFPLKSDNDDEYRVQIRSVDEETGLVLLRDFDRDAESPFVISESTPPRNIAPHGDVSFTFGRVTS